MDDLTVRLSHTEHIYRRMYNMWTQREVASIFHVSWVFPWPSRASLYGNIRNKFGVAVGSLTFYIVCYFLKSSEECATVAIGKPERHARKASHHGSKQQ